MRPFALMLGGASRRLGVCTLFMTVALASTASADPARDPVGAETLFKAARDLQDKGDWNGACAKFAASQELDPSVSTLVKLSQCKEHQGKLADAWYLLQEALKLNHDKVEVEKRRLELEAFTKTQIQSIEGRLPKLRINVQSAPPGLVVTRDGKAMPLAALGEAMPADPGAHSVVFEAPGYVSERKDVMLREGQSLDVSIALNPAAAPVVRSPSLVAPSFQEAPPVAADEPSGSSRKTAGFVFGGLGLAGLVAAGVLGGITASTAGSAAADATGNDARDQARVTQTGAFIAGGIGLAALGTGIILVATAPKASVAVSLRVGPSGAAFKGQF